MRILIISTNAIGDTYLSMSAVKIIKSKFPHSQITFFISNNSKFLFFNNYVEDIVAIKKNIFQLIQVVLINRIKNKKAEYAFSFFPGIFNSLLLIGLQSKIKLGFLSFNKKPDWFSRIHKLYSKNSIEKLNPIFWNPQNNYLDLIRFSLNKNFDISNLTKPKLSNANFIFSNKILIHFSSSEVDRTLTLNQLEILIVLLKKKYSAEIIIIGDKKDFIENIRKLSKYRNVEFIGNPSIEELITLIHCRLFFAVDSFPLHFADAYNTNFVGLFSKTFPDSVLINKNKSIKFDVNDFRNLDNETFETKIRVYLLKIFL
ncbi:MAG: glycosyltransferase family 9 protein [Ignavibacteriae bacterium]|nr:glycosyltransferase family 9 protein [Ignavibacteriota bacterium]